MESVDSIIRNIVARCIGVSLTPTGIRLEDVHEVHVAQLARMLEEEEAFEAGREYAVRQGGHDGRDG